MARRLAIPSKEAQLFIVGPQDYFKAHRVQRLSLNNDIPTTNIDELGHRLRVGSATDVPNVTLTFSAFDVSVKIFSILTGKDATTDFNPAGSGVDIGSLTEMDAVIYVKDATAETYIKSAHARRLQVRDFSYSYSTDGESTEDYTAIGSEKRWFKNTAVIDKFTTGAFGATVTVFTLSQTPIDLVTGTNAGNKLCTVIADGVYQTEIAAGTPAAGEYIVSAGTTLSVGGDVSSDVVTAIYHAAVSSAWTDVNDTQYPAAIRGRDVKVKIGANGIDRVQSVTINGAMNSQPVREMGVRNIVGYQSQVPDVDGTITVLDTDTDLMALLTGSSISNTEFAIEGGCTASGVNLFVYIYDPCQDQDTAHIVKTVYVPNLRITGESWTSNVNDNASQVFNWKGDSSQCIIFSGYKS